MLLVPMDNARELRLVAELFKSDFCPCCPKTDGFGRIADPQHRHPFFGDVALLPKVLNRIMFSVVRCNNTQRRRATIHCIQLSVMGEFHAKIPIIFSFIFKVIDILPARLKSRSYAPLRLIFQWLPERF